MNKKYKEPCDHSGSHRPYFASFFPITYNSSYTNENIVYLIDLYGDYYVNKHIKKWLEWKKWENNKT